MQFVKARYLIRIQYRYMGCTSVRPMYFESLPEAIRFHVYYLDSYMRFDSGIVRMDNPRLIQVF